MARGSEFINRQQAATDTLAYIAARSSLIYWRSDLFHREIQLLSLPSSLCMEFSGENHQRKTLATISEFTYDLPN